MSKVVNPKTGFLFLPVNTNTDGTPVVAGEIVQYNLLWGTTSGGPYPNLYASNALTPDANGKLAVPIAALGKLANGDYFAVVQAQTKDGIVSANSSEVAFSISPTPATPTGFSIA